MTVWAQAELFKDYGPVTPEEICYRLAFTPEPRKNWKLMPVKKLIRSEAGKTW